MNQELAFRNALLVDALSHELLGQFCAFALSHHPADHKTTEQVEDDVEIKVGPLERAAQLGDVAWPAVPACDKQDVGAGHDARAPRRVARASGTWCAANK